MRHIVLTAATVTTLALAATLSPAGADSYIGPVKNGNMCWNKQGGNSLGYWEPCKLSTKVKTSTRGAR